MEIWTDIKGYEGTYQVSNKGRVKSMSRLRRGSYGSFYISTGKLLKPTKLSNGYCTVSLNLEGIKVTQLVHRLVAIAFVANPENKPDVNHDNGNKACNEDWNLSWVTKSENMIHAYANGLCAKRRNRRSKSF